MTKPFQTIEQNKRERKKKESEEKKKKNQMLFRGVQLKF